MEQPTGHGADNWRKGVADMEEQGKIKGRNFGRQQTFTQRTGLTQMFRSKKDRTSHMHVVKAFEDGGRFNLFKVHGSAIFSRNVMVRSVVCAILGEGYYIANQMRPDRGVDGFTDFYWAVIGNCLSLLLVFKSNTAYSRFWEARGWVGTLCNATRSFMRRLLFTGRLRPGDGELEADVNELGRYGRVFFALMMQDVRLAQNLSALGDDLLTTKEKDTLLQARRRPLAVLGWMQVRVAALSRQGLLSERLQMALEEHLEQMSQAYHGCTKIRSQPLPFSYSQLIALLTATYCMMVPGRASDTARRTAHAASPHRSRHRCPPPSSSRLARTSARRPS